MKMNALLAFLAGTTLFGCSHSAIDREADDTYQFVTYQCESNKQFEVAYLIEEQAALLRLPKHDYRLIQVPSGSGAKYILDNGTKPILNPVTLHTKGDDARLELGRVVYKNCKTQ